MSARRSRHQAAPRSRSGYAVGSEPVSRRQARFATPPMSGHGSRRQASPHSPFGNPENSEHGSRREECFSDEPWLCQRPVPISRFGHGRDATQQIPVLQLRFTHDSIDSRLHFKNQKSIFKMFDQLQRGELAPKDLEPLDVCQHESKLYSMSNRRLFVLLMFQIVNRDTVVCAPCIMRTKEWKGGKFWKALTTKSDGLGIKPRETPGTLSEAMHRKVPIFDRGKSAFHLLQEVLNGSPYSWVLQIIRMRASAKEDGAHSLTVDGNRAKDVVEDLARAEHKTELDNLKGQIEKLTALLESKKEAERRFKERIDELEAALTKAQSPTGQDHKQVVQRSVTEPLTGSFVPSQDDSRAIQKNRKPSVSAVVTGRPLASHRSAQPRAIRSPSPPEVSGGKTQESKQEHGDRLGGVGKFAKDVKNHSQCDVMLDARRQNLALLEAASSGDVNAVKSLIAAPQVNVNTLDRHERTPLMWAAHNGHVEAAAALIKDPRVEVNACDKVDCTALMRAASNGHVDVVTALIIHCHVDVNARDQDGYTALLWAAQQGHVEVVTALINDRRTDVNARDEDGYTPLMRAALEGHVGAVTALISDRRVDVNARDLFCGSTPLTWAARNGHVEVATALINDRRVDVNAFDEGGWTALMLAAENGHAQLVAVLLGDTRVEVNETCKFDGSTALMYAAKYGHVEVVTALIKDPRVNVNARNSYGNTARMLALNRGRPDVADVLAKAGCP